MLDEPLRSPSAALAIRRLSEVDAILKNQTNSHDERMSTIRHLLACRLQLVQIAKNTTHEEESI